MSIYFALFTKDEIEKEPPDLKDQAAGVQKDEPLLRPRAVFLRRPDGPEPLVDTGGLLDCPTHRAKVPLYFWGGADISRARLSLRMSCWRLCMVMATAYHDFAFHG